MVFDFDDFGASHKISDMCQSHDCRDKLDELHLLNPAFKVTLFAIPGEMTWEMAGWVLANKSWVELAVHGFLHTSNYECEKMTYEEFNENMDDVLAFWEPYFVKGFKAPGWQISDDIYRWLDDNGWWVADQDYNTKRRPIQLPAYINRDGNFFAHKAIFDADGLPQDWTEIPAWHGHTWDCVGNGIYETFDQVAKLVDSTTDFKFVSEVLI